MWPDRVSTPGPLTYESGALPTALPGPAEKLGKVVRSLIWSKDNQSAEGAGGLGIIRSNKVGETE